MKSRPVLAAAALLLSGIAAAPAQKLSGTAANPAAANALMVDPRLDTADLYLDFAHGRYWQTGYASAFATPISAANLLTTTRSASNAATNLLPTSPAGYAYTIFNDNIARITPGLGLLVEDTRTNLLLHSAAPATQTTASLATGTYALWVNGSGSATMSSGTGTGCGTGAAVQGTPVSFTITVAGTCTVTVSGTLYAFQLELMPGTVSAPSSLIVTGASTVTRNRDTVVAKSVPSMAGQNLTVLASGVPLNPSAYAQTQTIIQLDDGENNNRLDIDRQAANGNVGAGLTVAVVAQSTAVQGCNPWATGASATYVFSLQSGATSTAFGGCSASHTGNLMFTPTNIVIGAGDAPIYDHPFNGYVSLVAIWPTLYQPQQFDAGLSLVTPGLAAASQIQLTDQNGMAIGYPAGPSKTCGATIVVENGIVKSC